MVSSAEQLGPRAATVNFSVYVRKGWLRSHSHTGCMCPGDPVLMTTEKAMQCGSLAFASMKPWVQVPSTHKTRLGGIYLQSLF